MDLVQEGKSTNWPAHPSPDMLSSSFLSVFVRGVPSGWCPGWCRMRTGENQGYQIQKRGQGMGVSGSQAEVEQGRREGT